MELFDGVADVGMQNHGSCTHWLQNMYTALANDMELVDKDMRQVSPC